MQELNSLIVCRNPKVRLCKVELIFMRIMESLGRENCFKLNCRNLYYGAILTRRWGDRNGIHTEIAANKEDQI
jgi:hypothetical protein